MFKSLNRIGLDPFVLTLLLSIFVAWLAPSVGADKVSWSPAEIAGWGVGLIFFFYGLRLNREKLKYGLKNYRLHLVIHLTTFILFPLLILCTFPLAGEGTRYYLWLGVFFMAALPSTVSSSVVMVSLAGGNIPAAIFNASISSLLGVFLTPLWMSIFLTAGAGGNELGDVILKLVFQVIVPVGAGMAMRRWWGHFADRHGKTLKIFDQTVIIAIVYTSFCNSFLERMFDNVSWLTLLFLCLALSGLFFLVYGIVWWVSRLLKFNREDTITAVFCGSKKSLVHGTVMAKVLIADTALTGILILPTMIYHALQLVWVGFIAGRMSREK